MSDFFSDKNHRSALFRARSLRRSACPVCGLYGCVCQLSLDEWIDFKPEFKDKRCPRCGLFLCDCPRDGRGEVIK